MLSTRALSSAVDFGQHHAYNRNMFVRFAAACNERTIKKHKEKAPVYNVSTVPFRYRIAPASTTGTKEAGNDHGRRATNHARTVGFIHAVGFVVGRGPSVHLDRLLFNIFLVRFLVEELLLVGIFFHISCIPVPLSLLVAKRDAGVVGVDCLDLSCMTARRKEQLLQPNIIIFIE